MIIDNNSNTSKWSLDELLYCLEGDTTVMRGLLLENTEVKKHIASCISGVITYDQLLDKVYEEF